MVSVMLFWVSASPPRLARLQNRRADVRERAAMAVVGR